MGCGIAGSGGVSGVGLVAAGFTISVGHHLYKAFPKLGVTTRAQLSQLNLFVLPQENSR